MTTEASDSSLPTHTATSERVTEEKSVKCIGLKLAPGTTPLFRTVLLVLAKSSYGFSYFSSLNTCTALVLAPVQITDSFSARYVT